MTVGAIGFVVGTGLVYYPLTVFFHNHVSFLSQEFYLPALIPSFFVSTTLNYWLNKRLTFKDCNVKRLSLLRYMSMGAYTWVFDVALMFLLVQYTHLFYLLALVIATLCMFLVRYVISKRWIWKKTKLEVA